MIKQNRLRICTGLLALAAWCVCALLTQRFAQLAPGLTVRWEEGDGVSAVEWVRARSRAREDGGADVPDAVLWKTLEGVVSRADGARTAAPDQIQVF